MKLSDHVKGYVDFQYYRDGNLWYQASESGLVFPVPIEDIGNATFHRSDKAILFMRYIRKHLEGKEVAKNENTQTKD